MKKKKLLMIEEYHLSSSNRRHFVVSRKTPRLKWNEPTGRSFRKPA